MALLLGIDIGTSGTKTLLCDETGKVLATATVHYDAESPKPGWSEQAPELWWDASCKATKAVLRKAKRKGHEVTGIGFSGQMHGSVMLDANNVPVRPALLWNDQRTAKQCEDIERAVGGRDKLIDMVGNPALTGFTAPKLLWVREHEPKKWAKVRRVMLPKDYVRLKMSGDFTTDVGDASGSLLLDVKARNWNTKLLDTLMLERDLLPPCVESHEVTGTLHAEGAKAMGLKAGIPVVAGSGDQPAGAVGNGIVRSGIVSASLGTSGVMFAHSDTPTYDAQGRVHTMCSAVAGKWCVFGCMLSAAGSLQWFRDAMYPKDSFEKLVELAATAPAGAEGLQFLPYLTGERCPHPDPTARGGWIGLTARHGKAEMTRALLEGVTFGMADALRIMAGDMGLPVRTVRLSGGGAKSAFWRQLQADIYGKTSAIINTEQGPAYGGAILAGVGTKVWPSTPAACKACIQEVETIKPIAKAKKAYAARHDVYRSLYPALTPIFPAMG